MTKHSYIILFMVTLGKEQTAKSWLLLGITELLIVRIIFSVVVFDVAHWAPFYYSFFFLIFSWTINSVYMEIGDSLLLLFIFSTMYNMTWFTIYSCIVLKRSSGPYYSFAYSLITSYFFNKSQHNLLFYQSTTWTLYCNNTGRSKNKRQGQQSYVEKCESIQVFIDILLITSSIVWLCWPLNFQWYRIWDVLWKKEFFH